MARIRRGVQSSLLWRLLRWRFCGARWLQGMLGWRFRCLTPRHRHVLTCLWSNYYVYGWVDGTPHFPRPMVVCASQFIQWNFLKIITCIWENARKKEKEKETYNSRDSLVVTHPTTSQPACGLSTAERTGSPVFHTLWSHVLGFELKFYMDCY